MIKLKTIETARATFDVEYEIDPDKLNLKQKEFLLFIQEHKKEKEPAYKDFLFDIAIRYGEIINVKPRKKDGYYDWESESVKSLKEE